MSMMMATKAIIRASRTSWCELAASRVAIEQLPAQFASSVTESVQADLALQSRVKLGEIFLWLTWKGVAFRDERP
jgi:hypothetical protein